jgi:hypothetical protein
MEMLGSKNLFRISSEAIEKIKDFGNVIDLVIPRFH